MTRIRPLSYYEKSERLKVLLKRYDISEKDNKRWFTLSMRLAEDHVPELFKLSLQQKKKGPTYWNVYREMAFLRDFIHYKKMFPDNTDEKTCELLSQKKSWKKRGLTTRALQNKFCALKKARARADLQGEFSQYYISLLNKIE